MKLLYYYIKYYIWNILYYYIKYYIILILYYYSSAQLVAYDKLSAYNICLLDIYFEIYTREILSFVSEIIIELYCRYITIVHHCTDIIANFKNYAVKSKCFGHE